MFRFFFFIKILLTIDRGLVTGMSLSPFHKGKVVTFVPRKVTSGAVSKVAFS